MCDLTGNAVHSDEGIRIVWRDSSDEEYDKDSESSSEEYHGFVQGEGEEQKEDSTSGGM